MGTSPAGKATLKKRTEEGGKKKKKKSANNFFQLLALPFDNSCGFVNLFFTTTLFTFLKVCFLFFSYY